MSELQTLWQQFLALLQAAVIKDAGPDVVALLTFVSQNGLDALLSPVGQAVFFKSLVSLQADAVQAGSDVVKQEAATLLAWVQAQVAARQQQK